MFTFNIAQTENSFISIKPFCFGNKTLAIVFLPKICKANVLTIASFENLKGWVEQVAHVLQSSEFVPVRS